MNSRPKFLETNLGIISGYAGCMRCDSDTVDNTSHLRSQDFLIEKFGGKTHRFITKTVSFRNSENQ